MTMSASASSSVPLENNPLRASTPLPSSSSQSQASNQGNFPPLASTIWKTTGREPSPLVGPSTTVVGDTLYVFGGRILSRSRPQLTSDMYALDLVTREWTKLETRGATPPPRYFHSVCALGDTKLVCFGGMSPANSSQQATSPLTGATPPPTATSMGASQTADAQNEVMVMSDIHIFDIQTYTWTYVPTANPPEGRYAHCATILPSTATFSSTASAASQQAEPYGGAEMVIVGGQDSANHYIEEINVFNLRSMTWTSRSGLGRSCGAYRSVVAPLGTSLKASQVGAGRKAENDTVSLSAVNGNSAAEEAGGMLIYSNYNFLDVRLELQIRLPDGSLTEREMTGQFAPPGLRFPNGGVLDNHFVVSGTFLTSSKQEYALWALDLRTLEWFRIDAGSVFSLGSWNRGVLWARRNEFLILGNKSRSLVEDYNHRRINFSNICMVELEAFGLYENPRRNYHPAAQKNFSPISQEFGRMVLGMKEMSDMELLAVSGERVPVNSRIVARRWGSYFLDLLNSGNPSPPPTTSNQSNRAVSMATITPHSFSSAATPAAPAQPQPPTTAQFNPLERPRTLYLPHTGQTLQALVHFLYTGSLPPAHHPQCTPQILCSLLQIARPYRIDGLLEVVVERLHQVLDSKNAAAVFNAAAMAAGGGAGAFISPNDDINGNVPLGDEETDPWKGNASSVIGLQKRGLRGLMEGRRMRERGRSLGGASNGGTSAGMQGTFGMG